MCEAPARGPSGPAGEGAERRGGGPPRPPPALHLRTTLVRPSAPLSQPGQAEGRTQGRCSPGRPRRLRSGPGLAGAGVLGAKRGLGERARSDGAGNFSADLYFLLFSFFPLASLLPSSPFCFSLFLFFLLLFLPFFLLFFLPLLPSLLSFLPLFIFLFSLPLFPPLDLSHFVPSPFLSLLSFSFPFSLFLSHLSSSLLASLPAPRSLFLALLPFPAAPLSCQTSSPQHLLAVCFVSIPPPYIFLQLSLPAAGV